MKWRKPTDTTTQMFVKFNPFAYQLIISSDKTQMGVIDERSNKVFAVKGLDHFTVSAFVNYREVHEVVFDADREMYQTRLDKWSKMITESNPTPIHVVEVVLRFEMAGYYIVETRHVGEFGYFSWFDVAAPNPITLK